MAPIKPFALDTWVNENRPLCKISLNSSCVEPLSLNELQSLDPSRKLLADAAGLAYSSAKGLVELRENITSLYVTPQGQPTVGADDVLVTAGAISANYLSLNTIVAPGDHVIVQYPAYTQLIEVPRHVGAEVSLWSWRQKEDSPAWTLDVNELKALIKTNTKLIVLSNPTNPTGSVMSREQLEDVVKVAKENDLTVMCDEVFRFLHHDKQVDQPPSLLELGYKKSIVTASMSKAFALPGIRVGWIATSPELRKTVLSTVAETSDYTTISVSFVDQQIAAFALSSSVRKGILERSVKICNDNIKILESFLAENKNWAVCDEPHGGGTCVLTVLDNQGIPVDDAGFAEALVREERICCPPARHCFAEEDAEGRGKGLEGSLRVGIVSDPEKLRKGLAAIARIRETWVSS